MNPRVRRFHECCRLLDQDNSESKVAADTLGQIVEEDMPQEYGIPYVAENTLKASTVSDQQARHYRGLWHELVQHLTDLGYLSEQEFVAYHKRRRSAADDPAVLLPVLYATRQYLTEEEWPELDAIYTGDFSDIQLHHLERYLGQLVERIARYTSFDGILPPPANYQVGQQNCYGRSLAYRLRTLITFDSGLNNVFVFTKDQIGFLAHLDRLLELNLLRGLSASNPINIPDALWQILCDLDKLYEQFIKIRPPRTRKRTLALVYTLSADRSVQDSVVSFSAMPSTNRENRWDRKLIRQSDRIDDPFYNFLGIRILQVKLWQTNFYIGAVDGKWGRVSHEAVEQLISQEEEILDNDRQQRTISASQARKQKRKLGFAMAALPDGNTYVVGLAPLYDLLSQYHNTTADPQDKVDSILTVLKEEENVDDNAIDKKILRDDSVASLYPDAVKKPRRRVAFTRMSFWQGIKRGIRRIGRWIANIAEKLFGPIFGFVKLILGRIRASIQQFFRGFRYLGYFLLGKPIVTPVPARQGDSTPVILASKFSLDWDGVNLISDNARPEDIDRHAAHIRDMKDSMFYFIDSTIKIIKAIGQLAQPGGWVWLGLKIARFLVQEVVSLVA